MVRAPCCDKVGLKKGPWSPDEDQILLSYITLHGHGNWRALPKKAGLMRCGKSCRLRWINYLRPDIKRGNFTREEEDAIINLHQILGNRWSAIAARLPGRTDNEIKNVWHTHLKKRLNNNLQGETINKETSSSSYVIDNKLQQPVMTSATTSREGYSASTCLHHVLDLSPQPCSSVTEDISSSGGNIIRRNNDNIVIGSTTTNNATSSCNDPLLEFDEPFWSEVLSEGTMWSSSVAAEAAPFQLSSISSGYGVGENGAGFLGCGYDNVMEFWNEGLDRCEDFFVPDNMF